MSRHDKTKCYYQQSEKIDSSVCFQGLTALKLLYARISVWNGQNASHVNAGSTPHQQVTLQCWFVPWVRVQGHFCQFSKEGSGVTISPSQLSFPFSDSSGGVFFFLLPHKLRSLEVCILFKQVPSCGLPTCHGLDPLQTRHKMLLFITNMAWMKQDSSASACCENNCKIKKMYVISWSSIQLYIIYLHNNLADYLLSIKRKS